MRAVLRCRGVWHAPCLSQGVGEGSRQCYESQSNENDETVEMKLEGRVAGPWAAEVGRVWVETAPRLATRKLVLDLRNVIYADAGGTHCSARSTRKRRQLLAGTLWTQSLAEQITRSDAQSEFRSFDMGTMQNAVSGCTSQSRLDGEFFNKLSPQALKDLGCNGLRLQLSGGHDSVF